MIARIVPITRLRRPTTTWSYLVPRGARPTLGSLVQISLGPRKVLGIVWELDDSDTQATKPLDAVLTTWPLMRTPMRNHAEWLASTTPSSLATIISWMLPAALSKPLTPTAQRLLSEFQWSPGFTSHRIIMLPSEREHIVSALSKRSPLLELWQESNIHRELERWLHLHTTEVSTVIGRELALYAPLSSVKEIVIIEPEDISYSLEQQPGISLIDAASNVAKQYGAVVKVQSYLPASATELLYNAQAIDRPLVATVELVDLTHASLMSNEIISLCKQAIAADKPVFMLLNAHDRLRPNSAGTQIKLPGIESFIKSLSSTLGLLELPPHITVGTRTELHKVQGKLWTSVVLSLDTVLSAEQFRDEMHGLADICKLLAKSERVIIQTYQAQHPLVPALLNGKLKEYIEQRVVKRQQLRQPPFASMVTILTSANPLSPEVSSTVELLQKSVIGSDWLCGSADTRKVYGKPATSITLYNPAMDALLPSKLRQTLGLLKRPWRVRVDRFG